jgi:hypothetical protein
MPGAPSYSAFCADRVDILNSVSQQLRREQKVTADDRRPKTDDETEDKNRRPPISAAFHKLRTENC